MTIAYKELRICYLYQRCGFKSSQNTSGFYEIVTSQKANHREYQNSQHENVTQKWNNENND